MYQNHLNSLYVFSQLADLKETDYQTTLAITALIELLIQKKLITHQELSSQATALANEAEDKLQATLPSGIHPV